MRMTAGALNANVQKVYNYLRACHDYAMDAVQYQACNQPPKPFPEAPVLIGDDGQVFDEDDRPVFACAPQFNWVPSTNVLGSFQISFTPADLGAPTPFQNEKAYEKLKDLAPKLVQAIIDKI